MQIRFELLVFNVSFQFTLSEMNLIPVVCVFVFVFLGANAVFMSKTMSFEVDCLAFWI